MNSDFSHRSFVRFSDSTVISAIRSGDELVFRDVYLHFHKGLAEFAFRYVRDPDIAEEIVQDVFMNVWINRVSWSPGQSVTAYLFGAVRNRALNVGRAKGVSERNLVHILSMYKHVPETDALLLKKEIEDSIQGAIAGLPERAREAVTLRWVHGMTHAEVAAVLEISEDAARKLIGRAAVQLRELLSHLKG